MVLQAEEEKNIKNFAGLKVLMHKKLCRSSLSKKSGSKK
jgi:hypothetical protein